MKSRSKKNMMVRQTKGATPRAMVLNYHFHYTCYRNLDRLMNHQTYGPMWAELSNDERTYVLRGGHRGNKR